MKKKNTHGLRLSLSYDKCLKESNPLKNGPVKVLDKDGNPHPDNIGNGSVVVCKLSVYDTTAGRGMRLEAVMVEELKAYTKPTVTAADNIVPF